MRERYLDYPGAANESECIPCPAGTFGMYAGADAWWLCIPCEPGNYSTAVGATSADVRARGGDVARSSSSHLSYLIFRVSHYHL